MDAINRFSPEDRACRTDNEFKLRYLVKEQGYRYSMLNCLTDIVIENTIKSCGCFYPLNYIDHLKVSIMFLIILPNSMEKNNVF